MTYSLELRNLRKSFGKTDIIRGVDLAVTAGERIAIIGPNGAGKSTLFNLISGRLTPSSGEVLLNGQRIDGMKPYEINRMGLSRSFQITNIFPKLTVFENLRCGVLWSLGYKYTFLRFLSNLDDANERTEELIRQIGLEKKRDVRNREVSFRDAIVIATSNAGADRIREYIERGYNVEQFEQQFIDELISSNQFRPEFLNRFDEIVVFRPFKKEELVQVLDLILVGVNKTLEPQKVSVEVDDEAKQILVDKGYDPRLGARPMRRVVQKAVENTVAKQMLAGAVNPGDTIHITGEQVAGIFATAEQAQAIAVSTEVEESGQK